MRIPILATDRLVLRQLRASDWDAYAAMNADPTVRQALGGKTLSREESWTEMQLFLGQWTLRLYGIFAVETDGCFAGRVGILHPADWREPELCWTLAASFWGRGLATEAAAEVRRWAFENFGWDRLVSYITPDNIHSRRVAERLGAVRQEQIVLRGVLSDVWVHPRPGLGVVT